MKSDAVNQVDWLSVH